MTDEERRQKARERQRAHRARLKGIVLPKANPVPLLAEPKEPEIFNLPKELAQAKLEAFTQATAGRKLATMFGVTLK